MSSWLELFSDGFPFNYDIFTYKALEVVKITVNSEPAGLLFMSLHDHELNITWFDLPAVIIAFHCRDDFLWGDTTRLLIIYHWLIFFNSYWLCCLGIGSVNESISPPSLCTGCWPWLHNVLYSTASTHTSDFHV